MFNFFYSKINLIKNCYNNFQKVINLKKIKPKYLFFSEHKKYQKYAYLLIENFSIKYPNEVYYVSSDINDKIENLNVKNIYVGKGLLMHIFFIMAHAQNMYLTVTDLDNNAVKKTKNIDKYIYYFHAPVSTTKVYTEAAFDNYDIILCNGDYHYNEIRKREEIIMMKIKRSQSMSIMMRSVRCTPRTF